jgi:hypothetical protein
LRSRINSPRRLWHPKENIDDFLLQSSVITKVGIKTFLSWDTDSHDETLSLCQRKTRALFGNWGMKLHNTRYHSPGIAAVKLQLLQTEGHLLERILRRVHSPDPLISYGFLGVTVPTLTCLPGFQ